MMRKAGLALVLLLAGLHMQVAAEEAARPATTPAQPPAQQYAESLQTAQELGRRLYRHEHAAALAGEALQATRKYRRDRRVQGLLTEARQDGMRVSFIGGRDGDTPAVLYDVEVPDEARQAGPLRALDPPQPLGESQHSAWRARGAVMTAEVQRCGKDYRIIVLPATRDGAPAWTAYLLPVPEAADLLPVGGSHRFDISADGTRIEHGRGFTKTCLVLRRDVNAISLMLTHLLDPIPTEIHVALNLRAGKGVYVATTENNALWEIENGVIRYVSQLGDKKEP